jgi:hypothetical protein
MLMPTADVQAEYRARPVPLIAHVPSAVPAPWPAGNGVEEVWLLGQPPLSRLLEFVEESIADGATLDRATLTTEWRLANDYYQALEKTEAGIANRGSHRELDPHLAHLAAEVAAHPHFRRTFDTLPTRIGMVELDCLIVYQKHVTRNFVEVRMARIGPKPDPETLFGLCLPLDEPETPVQIQKVGSRRYVFRSQSTDFRFHEPTLLRPGQMNGYESFGAIAGIVGLVVGFSSNFLNAVQVGQRVMLNNGYHRACALRALGVTHAPCIIQTASRADELEVTLKNRVADDPEFYFESARPPLLRDFFDPRIRKLLPIRTRTRHIEVNFEIKDYIVTE